MIDTRLLIDKYWHIVEASLIEFFEASPSEAYRLATSHRMKVEKRFGIDELSVFYNTEEYDIARQLADVSKDNWESDRERYFSLKFSYTEALEEVLSLSESA